MCDCVLQHRPKCATPNNHAKVIVLYDTERFPKVIYCASWLNGALAKTYFGLHRVRKCEGVVFHILCRYSQHTKRASGRWNQR